MDTPVATPEVVDPNQPSPPVPEDTSIAAHEASLQPVPDDGTEDKPQPRRHRQKDIATPADVQEINRLTRELRATEDALGIAQKPGESNRVYELRRRKEIAEAAKEARTKPAPVAETRQTDAPAAVTPVAAPGAFAFPAYDDAWLTKNPGKTWDEWNDARVNALYDWRRQGEQHQEQLTRTERDAAAETQRQQAAEQQIETGYQTRLGAFIKAKPDFMAKIEAAGPMPVPPVMMRALKLADNGPELVYALAQRPDLLAEMHLIGEAKPVTDATVASAQRWLQSRVQTGTTGAVATTFQTYSPPRPPTPVRTGPQPPSDEPPGDGASLRDHERFYGPKAARR